MCKTNGLIFVVLFKGDICKLNARKSDEVKA